MRPVTVICTAVRHRLAGPGWRAVALLVLALITPPVAAGQVRADNASPALLRIGAGFADFHGSRGTMAVQLEVVDVRHWHGIHPFLGLMTNGESALHLYAGLRLDIPLGRNWILTPSFAPGYYHDGSGLALGHDVQFRSAVEFARRLDNHARLGVSVLHISNGGLGDPNPGLEIVMLMYSQSLSRLFAPASRD